MSFMNWKKSRMSAAADSVNLEEHDKKYHPQGYEQGQSCSLRADLRKKDANDDLKVTTKKDEGVASASQDDTTISELDKTDKDWRSKWLDEFEPKGYISEPIDDNTGKEVSVDSSKIFTPKVMDKLVREAAKEIKDEDSVFFGDDLKEAMFSKMESHLETVNLIDLNRELKQDEIDRHPDV